MKDQLQLFRMWKQQTKMPCYQCGNNKLWTNLYHLNDKEWRQNASWVIPPYCTWHSQNWNLNSLFRSFCNKVSTKFVFFFIALTWKSWMSLRIFQWNERITSWKYFDYVKSASQQKFHSQVFSRIKLPDK